jgi:hypothetical protein
MCVRDQGILSHYPLWKQLFINKRFILDDSYKA